MPGPNSAIGQYTSFQPGPRLVDGGEVRGLANNTIGAQGGIVGTAAPGPVLHSYVNNVVSGANVQLPPALPGLTIIVVADAAGLIINANVANPATGVADQVNGAASTTLTAATASLLVCYRLGQWWSLIPAAAGTPTATQAENSSSGTKN